ncbi:MAG: glucosamine-6-phosphate deaminase [Clostridiales bacterium]|jgi:glucosamine-6-phosphate deaminase|nr:glucosamine-6-phosphate deaminase [Clostridiales bacterium]
MRIYKARDYGDMSRKAANILSAQVILKPNSVLGLATGQSPLGVYRQLIEWYAKGDIDFSEVTTINLDEYIGLPPDSPQSYQHFMRENFFSRVNIKDVNIHIPDGLQIDALGECARYDAVIRGVGGIDMQLLGIGHNGHIGFNEPGAAFEKGTHLIALSERTKKANSRFFKSEGEVPEYAYTMGIRSIMQARGILVVVFGEDKAEIVKRAFCGEVTPLVPASVLQLHNNVTLVGDEAALSQMGDGGDGNEGSAESAELAYTDEHLNLP